MEYSKAVIIHLFNVGTLTTVSADFLHEGGYAVICRAGKVVDIVPDE